MPNYSRSRIARLSVFTLAVIVELTMAAFGQDTTSIYSRLAPPSPSSGNESQIGIGYDGLYTLKGRIFFDVDASAVREPKAYVGDGWSVRSQVEAGFRAKSGFMIGGGITTARHSNSQYTKSQYQPIVTAHYRPFLPLDVYLSYLFSGSGNDNDVQGYRIGYRGTFQTSNNPHWGAFVQVEYTRFKFTTSFRERITSNVTTLGFGVSRIHR